MSGAKKIVNKNAKTALQRIAEKLKNRTRRAVESVDPIVASSLAGLGAVSQTDQMQDIGSAAIDVTGSRREKGDGFFESYVPGFGPSDRIKRMSKEDRLAEINDYGRRRREKNDKPTDDKPTDDKPASKKFKLTPKDVTREQLENVGLDPDKKSSLTKYLNAANELGKRPRPSDFVDKKSGGGMAKKKPVKKKVVNKAKGGMGTKWESKWRG